MKNLFRNVVFAAMTAACLFVGRSVLALGFANPDQDARATGQGEAFVAQADDASAAYYNPAGLTQLHGTEITSGFFLSFPDSRLAGTGSGGEMNTWAKLPQFYVATDFGLTNSPWRFALGCDIPFGDAANFSNTGPFRYIVTESMMAVVNIQPTVAYQVNDKLSLGAGVNIYYSEIDQKNQAYLVPDFGPGTPDGHFHFNGSGQAIGATAGLMWKVFPELTLGITYHSPFSISYTGNAQLNLGGSGGVSQGPAQLAINFPQSVACGLAWRPIPPWKLEGDVQWTDWATLDKVTIAAPNTAFNNTSIPFHYQDSWYYEFGTQYEIDPHWTVRGGYIYSQNSVPNSGFSPTVPDSNRQVFSLGLGYAFNPQLCSHPLRVTVDLVYQYSLSQDRNVTIPLGNGTSQSGTWKSDASAAGLTTSVNF
jgi:long-chain fatty acid transport protein